MIIVTLNNHSHGYTYSASPNGDVGILHWINAQLDIDWIIKDAPSYPFIPVVPVEHFTT